MKDRLRKKIWKKHWFFLRLQGHDFYSFNTSDYRHCLNCVINCDPLIGSYHIR